MPKSLLSPWIFQALLPLIAVLVVACGGGDQREEAPATEAPSTDVGETATVTIVSPAAGETLTGPVTVVFEVEGLALMPAGTMDSGTGHHHLVIDTVLGSWTEPIPALDGRFIHLGQAQTEFVLEGLEPGEHRVIAVVADGVHVPLDPPVVDTVVFTVN